MRPIRNLRLIYFFSGLFVPFIALASPNFLTLQGVSPCWPIFWLLPFALEFGPKSGLLAGLCLGLVLDGISLGGASQVPALLFLGFWWGRIGKKGLPVNLSLNLGLLAWIGTIIFGLSIWLQFSFLQGNSYSAWFNYWAFHTLLAQTIVTGLLAPMICSWLILARRRKRLP